LVESQELPSEWNGYEDATPKDNGGRVTAPHAMNAALIIPALNEEGAIGQVLDEVPEGLFATVIVADNGSIDKTAVVAAAHGAQVVHEPTHGYGNACLRALKELPRDIEIVVFMDADGSDSPGEVEHLLGPILEGQADLVLGSREMGVSEPGSLSAHQRLGNFVTTLLVGLLCGHRYSDLGPFRAIRADRLRELEMRDPNYGWTIEMQIKALRRGLRVIEVPVSYRRRRAGESKISGTVWGSLAAGVKILWTVTRLSFSS